MATSPQYQKLVQLLFARRRPPEPLAVETMRAGMIATALPVAADVARATVVIGGARVEELTPPGADPERVVLYVHGGGFVLGSPDTHRKLAADVGRASGARVLLPDYPLAPEHPFPAALEWLAALHVDVLASGVAPERLAIAGDSAGGGLTASLLVLLRDRGVTLPAAGALISPWLDLVRADVEGDGRRAATDPIMTPDDLAAFGGWYLDGADPRHPLVSPVHAEVGGLPPLLIHAGEAELIVEDARTFAEHCRAAGVAVELEVWPEMIHVWHLFAGRVPEATAAVDRIGTFLRARLA